VTRNCQVWPEPILCQIYIMPLNTLKTGIYKLKYFMNCIKVKRTNLLNSIYSSVSPDFRFIRTLISLLTRNCRVHCTQITSNTDMHTNVYKLYIKRKSKKFYTICNPCKWLTNRSFKRSRHNLDRIWKTFAMLK